MTENGVAVNLVHRWPCQPIRQQRRLILLPSPVPFEFQVHKMDGLHLREINAGKVQSLTGGAPVTNDTATDARPFSSPVR